MEESKSIIQNKLHAISFHDISPTGWLADELRLQMDGITGCLDEYWGSVCRFSDWFGGTENSWERPPYWLDGLVPLAWLLRDERGMEKARKWMEWSLSSQREDGDFGPAYRTREFEESLFWPKYVMLKALISYYEVTGEQRVMDFILRYLSFCNKKLDSLCMSGWSEARGGDFAYVIYWVYEKTGQGFLLELAGKVDRGTLAWEDFFADLPFPRPTGYYYNFKKIYRETTRSSLYEVMCFHYTHIVNVTMGLKQPAMSYRLTGDRASLDAVYAGLRSLYQRHGQVAGVFSGDEHLNGVKPTKGTELCSVVEYLFSLQVLLETTGDPYFADLLERVAYNALPATLTEDFRGHQYDQQANQVLVSLGEREWYNNDPDSNLFGFEPNFGCCLANLHQGWPKLVKNAFWADDAGLRAAVYMPVDICMEVNGKKLRVHEETNYPAQGRVRFRFELDDTAEFPFSMRIPGWCKAFAVLVNGVRQQTEARGGWAVVTRAFRNGDIVELSLRQEVRIEKGRYHEGVTVERGPLIFALKIKEEWRKLGYGIAEYPDYEVFPQSPWNYALDLSQPIIAEESGQPREKQLFSWKNSPITLHAKGVRLPDWELEQNSAGDLPVSPVRAEGAREDLELIPYGCTALRVSLFPWC